MATEVVEVISQTERIKLENYESTIEHGRRSVYDSGRALRAIRDEKLYREHFATFGEYCENRWKFTKQRASQLIGLHDFLLENYPELSTVVDGQAIPEGLPKNERYVRELKRLPGNQQKECWLQIEQLTADGDPKLTLTLVKTTVDAWMAKSLAPAPGEGMSFDSDATEEVEAEDKGPRLPPISRPIEENPAETADRIARSTVYTMNRDWRLVPIAFRERFVDSVRATVAVFERELYPDGDSEADDA